MAVCSADMTGSCCFEQFSDISPFMRSDIVSESIESTAKFGPRANTDSICFGESYNVY